LAAPHANFGDLWLERKIVVPMAKRNKPFEFDGNETLYDPEGRQRTTPGVTGHQVSFKISECLYDRRDGGADLGVRGEIGSINGILYSFLKPYICGKCQIELETELRQQAENARLQFARANQKRRYEATWRHPLPGEFAVASGNRKFALVGPTLSVRNIEFQWRTSKLFCRGSSPAFIMLMTVDGVFSGKCYHTYEEITGSEEHWIEEGSIGAEEYAATTLLTRWIQQNLQADLRSVDPLFVWDTRRPLGCPCYLENRAGVIQTTWVDGVRFAALVGFHKIVPEIVDFLGTVGYRLIEQRNQTRQSVLAERGL